MQNHKRVLFIAAGSNSITYAETALLFSRHHYQLPSDKRIYHATVKIDTNRNYPTRSQSHPRTYIKCELEESRN